MIGNNNRKELLNLLKLLYFELLIRSVDIFERVDRRTKIYRSGLSIRLINWKAWLDIFLYILGHFCIYILKIVQRYSTEYIHLRFQKIILRIKPFQLLFIFNRINDASNLEN